MVSVRKQRSRSLRPPIKKPPTLTHDDCSDNSVTLPEERNHPENHVLDQDSNPNFSTDEAVASSHALVSALVTIPASRQSMSLTEEKAESLQELELDIEQLELQRAGIDIRPRADTQEGPAALEEIDTRSPEGDMEPVPDTNVPVQLNRPWSEDEEDDDIGDQKVESKIVSRCLVIDREMSYEERMKYIFGSSIVSNYRLHGGRKGRSRRTLRSPRRIIPNILEVVNFDRLLRFRV